MMNRVTTKTHETRTVECGASYELWSAHNDAGTIGWFVTVKIPVGTGVTTTIKDFDLERDAREYFNR